jgi:drug/metabolite transporter (DMT)-like permease
MLAVNLALLSGLCFAAAGVFAQKGLHIVPTPWGVWITLAINSLFLSTLNLLLYPDAPILVAPNLLFVVIGLFVPGLTRMLAFRGFRKMGSSITTTVTNSTSMFSAILAIIFLGERPGPMILSGIGLIVGGLMAISWGKEKRDWDRAELLYPLLAALLFASKDVLAKWGLAVTGQPILAAAITSTTATVEVFLIIRCIQKERFSLPPLRISVWFVVSGLFTCGAFLFMFLALDMAHVTIVAPLVNSHSIYVLFLAPLVIGKIEKITVRKVIGSVGVVAGVLIIFMGRQ